MNKSEEKGGGCFEVEGKQQVENSMANLKKIELWLRWMSCFSLRDDERFRLTFAVGELTRGWVRGSRGEGSSC